jgi:RNA polymerase sigma factor for flagellar operon FliA
MTTIDLFARAHSGNTDARNELIQLHTGLVHFIARRLARTLADGVDLDELASAGYIGLMQAVEGFDPTRGLTFSTFASARVRGAMLDELRRLDSVSRGARSRARELQRVRNALSNRLGRRASQQETAAAAGVNLRTLWRWESDAARAIECSLDAPFDVDDSDSREYGDSIPASVPDVDFEIDRELEREYVRDALEELTNPERRVLSMYFFDEMSLQEIAPHLGVTESGASRIRTRALRSLRDRLERRGYQAAFAA